MRREIFAPLRSGRSGLFAGALVLLIPTCSTPDDTPPRLEAFVPRIASRPHHDLLPTPQPPPPPPPPTAPTPPPVHTPPIIPTTCMKTGTVTSMATRGASFVACLDVDHDATPDQCVEWNRANGHVVKIEPVADLEDGPPPVVTDDKVDDSDDRITQEANAVQVCPEDRVCVKLMPRLNDSATMESVHGDANHHNIAIAITDGDGENGHLEFWDIQAGRLRSRVKVAGEPSPDTSFTFSAKPYGDAIISAVTRSDNSLSSATLYGIDGARRATLAAGSKFVDLEQTIVMSPGVIAVFDSGPPGRPYYVFLHSISGGTLGRFTVRYEDDGGSDTASMMKIDATTIGVVQRSSVLQIDVLDTRSGSGRTFKAPGC